MAIMENEMAMTLPVTDSNHIALNASGQTKIQFSGLCCTNRLEDVLALTPDEFSLQLLFGVGSFNWLSADRYGQYARHEASFVYRGQHLESEIGTIFQSLGGREK